MLHNQLLFAACVVMLKLNIFVCRCRFVREEKGLEFINNVHLGGGCRDSTVSALLINQIPFC